MSQLLSKIVAGGLSAAVILIWWPRFFPVDSVETWLARGVVWTLGFELLVLALAPAEQAVWRSAAAHRLRSGAAAARDRVTGNNPKAGTRLRSVFACTAVAVPVALLASAPAPPADDTTAAKPITHVTQVKRVVRVERPDAGLSDAPAQVTPDTAPAEPATRLSAPARSSAPLAHRRAKPSVRRPARGEQQAPAQGDSGSDPPADPGTDSPAPDAADEPRTEPDASGSRDASLRRFAG